MNHPEVAEFPDFVGYSLRLISLSAFTSAAEHTNLALWGVQYKIVSDFLHLDGIFQILVFIDYQYTTKMFPL